MFTSVAGPTTACARPLMPLIHWCGESPRIVTSMSTFVLPPRTSRVTPAMASNAARSRPRPSRRSAIAGARPRVASTATFPESDPPYAATCTTGASSFPSRSENWAWTRFSARPPCRMRRSIVTSPFASCARNASNGTGASVNTRWVAPAAAGLAAATGARGAGRSARSSAVEVRLTVHKVLGPASRMSILPLTLLDPNATSMSCRATTLSSRVILSAIAVFLPATSPRTATGYETPGSSSVANGPSLPARETAVPSIEPLNSASTCDSRSRARNASSSIVACVSTPAASR